MKSIGSWLIALLMIPLFSVSVLAIDIEQGTTMAEDAVPYEVRRQLQQEGISSVGELLKLSPDELWRYVSTRFKEGIRASFKGILTVMGVMLITAAFTDSIGTGDLGASAAIELATMLWVTFAITNAAGTAVTSAITAIEQCGMFMISYIPVYSGVAMASGLPSSALVYHTTLMWIGQGVSQLASTVLAPLLSVYCSISLAGVISGNSGLASISGTIKKTVIWILTLAMTVFVGVVTLQSFVQGVTDLSVGKTAKFLMGTFIPVVGSVVADAFSVAKNSLMVIKSAVGTIGIGGAVAIFAPSLIRLASWKFALGISSMVGELVGAGLSVKIIKVFSDMTTLLLAVMMSVAMVFIISTAVILSLGVVR